MNAREIRQRFIDFFVERGHLEVPSLPLAPNDASITTLFTIAGMQQMIPYFLGRETPRNPLMVNVQKAVRTVDIDEVGDDTHLTYLEMLGNFSVGQYFKREAVAYTWEFLTESMGIPADRWWVTHYPDDQVAHQAWLDVGVRPDRIGETEENFWGPPGPFGPCGPDSEIHYDRGIQFSCGREDCRPENECCDRFLETWNNVFMEYYQEENGERRDLPMKNIDTGMGLERLVTVAQGVSTPYETDLFQPIFAALAEETGVIYGERQEATRPLRIISDHARAVAMLISDGVMPSSEARGYVVRRLIRRAALLGRTLGVDRPFLSAPVSAAIDVLGAWHADLPGKREHILQVVRDEEQRFLRTVARGLDLFESMAERARGSGGVIAGADAFTLSDTYGFPLELTRELAAERNLSVDEIGFARSLTQQRERARQGREERSIGVSPETFMQLASSVPSSTFTGYEELQTTAEVVALLVGGTPVPRAESGDTVDVILDRTPFYAESGGQVGDTGTIRSDGARLRVIDTQRPFAAFIVHRATVDDGAINAGDVVVAEVDTERRLHILPHHSGTHLLHKALQEVLGPAATQAGSLVEASRLRFDFRWPRAMTEDELREVEDRVNAAIWANLPVGRQIMSYDEAIRDGAMALFGEKYGDMVRVVSMGDWSKELCGGTHVRATGDIGLLLITGESGIGSGVRRIEALAGAAAYTYVQGMRHELKDVAAALDTRPDGLPDRVRQLVSHTRQVERRAETLSRKLAQVEGEALARRAVSVDGVSVVAEQIVADEPDYLRVLLDAVKSRLDRGIVVLAAQVDGSPRFTMAVPKSLSAEGFHAGRLLNQAARQHAQSGGGTPEFAQGGGSDVNKMHDVLETVVELVRRKVEERV